MYHSREIAGGRFEQTACLCAILLDVQNAAANAPPCLPPVRLLTALDDRCPHCRVKVRE